jgi:hypothetical protein
MNGAMMPVMWPLLFLAIAVPTVILSPAIAASRDHVAASLQATTSLLADFTRTGTGGKVSTGRAMAESAGGVAHWPRLKSRPPC